MIFSNNLIVANLFGKLPGEATDLLDKASAVFKFMGTDLNGKAILHEITSYPVL